MTDMAERANALEAFSGPAAADRLRRNTDPGTSHEAANAVVADGTVAKARAKTLAAVTRWPMLTTSELAQNACVRDPRFFGRRLPELERSGLIVRHPPRKCAVTGRKAAVWDVHKLDIQGLMFGSGASANEPGRWRADGGFEND